MTVIAYREGSDTEQNLGLWHDDLKPVFGAFGRSDRRAFGTSKISGPTIGLGGMSLHGLKQIRSMTGPRGPAFNVLRRDAGRSVAAFGYVAIRMAFSDHFCTQNLACSSVSG